MFQLEKYILHHPRSTSIYVHKIFWIWILCCHFMEHDLFKKVPRNCSCFTAIQCSWLSWCLWLATHIHFLLLSFQEIWITELLDGQKSYTKSLVQLTITKERSGIQGNTVPHTNGKKSQNIKIKVWFPIILLMKIEDHYWLSEIFDMNRVLLNMIIF